MRNAIKLTAGNDNCAYARLRRAVAELEEVVAYNREVFQEYQETIRGLARSLGPLKENMDNYQEKLGKIAIGAVRMKKASRRLSEIMERRGD